MNFRIPSTRFPALTACYQEVVLSRTFIYVILLVSLILLFSSPTGSAYTAQDSNSYIRQKRRLEVSDLGILNPAGLAFSPSANAFHIIEAGGQVPGAFTNIVKVTPTARLSGMARIGATIMDPVNMAFDGRFQRLLIYQAESKQLIEVREDVGGNLDPATLVRHDAKHFGLENAQGMTIDQESGHLFILDGADLRIVRIEPEADGSFQNALISEGNVGSTGLVDPRGLALDPTTGHLHILNATGQALYELTQTGQLVTIRDLTEFGLAEPRGIVFAPSGDLTDDPAQMSLYLAEKGVGGTRGPLSSQEAEIGETGSAVGDSSGRADGGDILEFTFVEPVAVTASTFSSSLVQTINAFEWNPPSPDSSGVVYLPASDTLMVVDGEVNEMPIYQGANVFQASLPGELLDTWTTLDFSNEPTGVAVNPSNEHLFISQDTGDRLVHEVDPGPDGNYGTADDVVTSLVAADFGSNDPEGVTYAPGLDVIFLADGVNNEIYRIDPGANGNFDGVPPAGDDQVTSFDTFNLGVEDPEGVAYNADTGNLYIAGRPSTTVLEVTPDGVLVQSIDVSAANARRLSGVGYGPSSVDPFARVLYIADRGVDNGSDPNENDGRIYELTLPNSAPAPPVANDDIASTTENTAVTIDVAANDSDLNGNLVPASATTTCSNCSDPTSGALNNNSDGTFTYMPDPGFTGSDSFIYEICDTDNLCDTATVNISVTINDPPVADDDSAGTGVDTIVTIDVAANDFDPNGNLDPTSTNTSCGACAGPASGTLANNGDGTFDYLPNPGFSGFDSFVYQICDTAGACDTATVSITVENIVEVRVNATADDAEEQESGSVGLGSSDLELVLEDSNQTVGIRFNGINVPQGATITGAYVQFQADETNSEATSLLIQGEATDNAVTFTDTDGNISSRVRTANAVSWTPVAWANRGEAGPDQRTPDIAQVIQEVVARPGWTSGNSLVLIITGSGKRVAESFDGIPDAAPLLHVEYTSGDDQNPMVTINDPAGGSTFNQADTITFSGTADDVEDGDLTATLTWESDLDGPLGSGGSFSRSDLSVGVHTIRATVSDTAGQTGERSTTLTVFAPANVLAGAGDIADSGPWDEATALLLETIPGTVFTLGDNAYPEGSEEQFNDYYDPTWGRHKSRTRPSVGNHDYLTLGAAGYYNYFGTSAGDPLEGYYSYDVGDWHIVVLNSECAEVGGCGRTDPQGQWLQADLAANPAACTLAYWHHPRFSSAGDDLDVQDFWSLLYEAGADVVLNGHIHSYERFALQDPSGVADPDHGIREFVVGTGGSDLSSPPAQSAANSEVQDNSSHGVLKLTLHPAGYDWEFIPVAGDSFTDLGSGSCVSPPTSNNSPVANDDAYPTDEDTTLSVAAPGVLANDTDADSDPLTGVLDIAPVNGSLLLNSDGSFSYTPDADFNGSDSFTYRANDGTSDSNVATVTITVNAVNDTPVANDDTYTTGEDTALTVAAPGVLGNDGDVDGDTLTGALDTAPGNGTLTLNTDGSFTYTPDANFTGTDSFSYHANDGTADSSLATVTITVDAVNDAPVANDDAYSTDEDTALNVAAPGILDNDSDVEGDALVAVLDTPPGNGSLVLDGDGSFTYTPNADFSGEDGFSYHASDGTAGSNVATVLITVNPINDAPVANDDAYNTSEGTTLTVAAPGVLANDTDAENDPLAVVLDTSPANGALTLNADGSFSYTPAPAFIGSDSFTYHATDGVTGSNVAAVTITVNEVNEAPVANDDAYLTDEDTTLTVAAPGVLGNDSDGDGDPLTAVLDTPPGSGSLTLNGNGSFSYTPAPDFNGSDSFSYYASDGIDDSTVATVSITVNPVNDAPAAVDDAYATSEDATLNVAAPGVLGNDSDTDGDPLTAVLDTPPANGNLALSGDGAFTYTPAPDFNGSDSFTYHANDGTADSSGATVSITVNPANDVPVAVDDAFSTDEDTTLDVTAPGVLGNDSDADGDGLTAVIETLPINGSLILNEDGSFSYTSNADFNGTDSFTYRANDGNADSNIATVMLTVNAVNDAPQAVDDSYTTDVDTTLSVTAPGVLANDTDAENDPLVAVLDAGPANGTLILNVDGSFTYTPTLGFAGSDTFAYHASDGTADSNVVTVSITVNAASLSLISINPDSAVAGATVFVTVNGTGFQPGATLSLENGQGPAPDITDVVVVDDSTLTATLSFKQGGPPRDRPWDVRVTNPDGQADVLLAGFTVTTGTTATVTESRLPR